MLHQRSPYSTPAKSVCFPNTSLPRTETGVYPGKSVTHRNDGQ